MDNLQTVIADPSAFVKWVASRPVGDVCDAIRKWTITDLMLLDEQPEVFEQIISVLPEDAFNALDAKLHTTGVRFAPGGRSKYAVVSVTNMRQRSNFMLLLVAQIAFLYRSLEERSRDDAPQYFDVTYSSEQRDVIKSFLDQMFEYNPETSINRYTSELYTPEQAKLKVSADKKGKGKSKGKTETPNNIGQTRDRSAKTMDIRVEAVETRVKDRTKSYSRDTPKWHVEEHTAAEIHFPAPDIKVKVDPPSDFYAKFFTFYNAHFDGIYKTTWELFLEGRAGESLLEKDAVIYEHVSVYAGSLSSEKDKSETKPESKDTKKKKDEARLIQSLRLPAPNAQWQDTIMVVAPENGRFFNTPEEAESEMMKHKGTTISDLMVVPTDATVLLGSWYANKRRIITSDETANALFRRIESDHKVSGQLNKKRVEDSKFREMIAEGPDSEEFLEYLRSNPSHAGGVGLDEWDEAELQARYRAFKLDNLIYDNTHADFVTYVKNRFPSRDFDRYPMSVAERKQFSRDYSNSNDVIELPNSTDKMALDFFEMGGPDPANAGIEMRREFVDGIETPVKR